MPLQPVTHRVQEPEEPPSIRRTVIGRGFFVGATLVVAPFRCRRDRRHPSMSFRSIKKNRSHLFYLLGHPRITTNQKRLGRVDTSLSPICKGCIHRLLSPKTEFIVDTRINETLQIGRRCFQLRRFNPPNGVYAVRLETAPTGG